MLADHANRSNPIFWILIADLMNPFAAPLAHPYGIGIIFGQRLLRNEHEQRADGRN
jgi:hypothetical protein